MRGVDKLLPGLTHAAKQLGLESWLEVIDALPHPPERDNLEEIIETLGTMVGACADEFAESRPELATGDFLEQAAEALIALERLHPATSEGVLPDSAILQPAVSKLCDVSEAFGYVRVTSAARTLLAATDMPDYRRSTLRLFEELLFVENTQTDATSSSVPSPRALLRKLAAEQVFETLENLRATLDRLGAETASPTDYRNLERFVRLVHHACGHYRLELASELAMSILDLFSRCGARGIQPDVILLRIAKGFVETLEMVFEALRDGVPPDLDRLQAHLRDVTDADFLKAGGVTSGTIERRLGLPAEFHKVLSPESTMAAKTALDAGLQFFILRADVNSDNAMAEALFDLIGSEQIQAITNVTVFEGDKTIFDFLIAADTSEEGLVSTLAELDPNGQKIACLAQPVACAGRCWRADRRAC